MGWEQLQYLQGIGFLFLLSGALVYNDLVIRPALVRAGYITADPDEVLAAKGVQY